jgi:capsular polysaccharide transport system permease protein
MSMINPALTQALSPAPPVAALPRAEPAPRPQSVLAAPVFAPPVPRRRLQARGVGLILSFVLFVALPVAVTAWYLWARAADQFAATTSFSVRREEAATAQDMLGGLSMLGGASSADTDILYDYMQSPRLVAEIDRRLDLRAIWSKAGGDPVFAYAPPGTIEDLAEHWQRKVRIAYDSSTRLIELTVLAFDPDDALAIARAVLASSGQMINEINRTAREDTVRQSRQELARAEARLAEARTALTGFRARTRIVDPGADVAGQTGLLAHLEAELAEALIAQDMTARTAREGDFRLEDARARVAVIEARLADQRDRIGTGTDGRPGTTSAAVLGEFERLNTEVAFAEESYRAARATLDAAEAQALRQTRYLAAHVPPARPESARYPRRATILATVAGVALLLWSVMALTGMALADRR